MWLTLVVMALGISIGVVAAVLADAGLPIVNTVYVVYITLIRGTPVLLQLVFAYTVLPVLGVRLTVVQAAIAALSINEGAYVAEIVRSGLRSIPRGQRDAAQVTGLGYWKMMALIILPQALRVVVPALGNQVNAMFKNTSLASVISVTELFQVTQQVASQSFRYLEAFSAAALMYLIMTGIWSIVQLQIERATHIPGMQRETETRKAARILRLAVTQKLRRRDRIYL